jgi:hypothetical protein
LRAGHTRQTIDVVSYRDDREADQARISALQNELTLARDRIAELEGRREQALVLASRGALERAGTGRSAAQTWFGAPFELALTRELPGSFPADHFEDVIERIRTVTRDAGRSELLKSSLTWSANANPKGAGPFTVITVSVRDGKTRITATDRLSQLAGALFGGIGGGVGGGAIIAPILATAAMPALGPVFFLGWFGSVYAGTRMLFKRIARRRAEQLQQVFEAVCEEIARGIPSGT